MFIISVLFIFSNKYFYINTIYLTTYIYKELYKIKNFEVPQNIQKIVDRHKVKTVLPQNIL